MRLANRKFLSFLLLDMGLTNWKGQSGVQLDRADAGIKLPAGDRLDQCRSLRMLSMAAACFSCRQTGKAVGADLAVRGGSRAVRCRQSTGSAAPYATTV